MLYLIMHIEIIFRLLRKKKLSQKVEEQEELGRGDLCSQKPKGTERGTSYARMKVSVHP